MKRHRQHCAGRCGLCGRAGRAGGHHRTVEQVAGLLASVDVSDQAPFDAMARLGLKLVQRALP